MKSKTTSLAVLLLLACSSFFAAVPLAIPAYGSGFSVGTPTLASPAIDGDQSVVVHGAIPSSGGTAPFSWSWLVSFDGGAYGPDSAGADFCGANASGSGAIAGRDVSCTMSKAFPVLIPFGTYNFELSVTDSASTPVNVVSSPSATLTVSLPISFIPSQTTSGLPSPYIMSGQTNVITVTPAGGTAPYTYTWTTSSLTVSSGCTSSSTTCSVTGTTTGVYSLSFKAVDSAGSPETFGPAPIYVIIPPLLAGTATPGGPTIDSGQSVTLTSAASGGSGTNVYQWFTVTTTVCALDSPIAGATSATYGASPASTTSYYYVATDILTGVSACSPADTVTVNPALVAAAPTLVVSGSTVIVTSHATGGSGVLTYQWYSGASATCSSDSAIGGATSVTYSTAASIIYYCYTVTDHATVPVTMTSATVLASLPAPPLTVTLGQDSLVIQPGGSVTFTAYPSSGAPPYTYVWTYGSGLSPVPGFCELLDPKCILTSNTPGTYQVSVTVTDSKGKSVTSSADSFRVAAILQITFSYPKVALSGKPFAIQASVSGASGAVTYTWVPSGTTQSSLCGNSSVCIITPGAAGSSFSVILVVSDTNDDVGKASMSFTAVAPLALVLSGGASFTVLAGKATTLSATVSGGVLAYAYAWSLTASGGSSYLDLSGAAVTCPSAPTCPVTWSVAGDVTVTLIVTDTSGQSATATQKVTVKAPPPTITLTATPSCLSPGSSTTFTATVKTNTSANTAKGGYFLVSSDGLVCAYGSAVSQGSFSGSATFVGMASKPDGTGYWLLSSNGQVSAFGSASNFSDLPSLGDKDDAGRPWVGIVASPDGTGYWVVSEAGAVIGFHAPYHGSVGFPSPPGLGLHIFNFVGMASTPDGYRLVQSNGGIFSFHAAFYGSLPTLGVKVNDVVGIASTPDGGGYWILESDGTVHGFGDAGSFGSATSGTFVGMASTPDGKGYWLLSSGGTVLNFGDAGKLGDGASLGRTWVGMSAVSGKTTKATGSTTALPVVGATVNFDVLSGPDAGKTFTATTNASGMAPFTFSGGSTSGVDIVTATTTGVGSGTLVLAKGSVTFVGSAASTGPDTILVSGKVQSAVVGKNATVGVRVFTSGGANAPGVPVTFLVTSGPDKGDTVTSTTDGYGVALFSFKGAGAGNDIVSVTAQTTGTPSATMQLEWAAPLSFSLGSSTTSTTQSITAWKSIKQDVKLALGLSCQGPSGSCGSSAIFRPGALAVDYPLQAGAPTSAIFYFTPLDAPEAGTSPSQLQGTLLYFDIYLSPTTPLPSGTTVQICLTAQSFTSSSQLQYWNGSAWVSPSPSSASGDTVCGAILTSNLTGTPFVVNALLTPASTIPAASQGLDTSYLAIPFAILLVGALIVALSARRPQS